MSVELYVTSSAIRPLLCHLTENARKIELTNPIAINKLKTEMRNNLQSRYRSESIIPMLNHACFVDPRFKTMPFLGDSERENFHDHIVGEMESHILLLVTYSGQSGEQEASHGYRTTSKKAKDTLRPTSGRYVYQKR